MPMETEDVINEYHKLDQKLEELARRINAADMSYRDIFRNSQPKKFLKRLAIGAAAIGAGVIFYHGVSATLSHKDSSVPVIAQESHYAVSPRANLSEQIPDLKPAMATESQKPVLPESVKSPAKVRKEGSGKVASYANTQNSHEAVLSYLNRWKTAWETGIGLKDFYDAKFVSDRGETIETYLSRKDSYLSKRKGSVKVSISGLKVISNESNKTCVEFLQDYRSNEYSDRGYKTMCISRDGKGLSKIVSESWRPR